MIFFYQLKKTIFAVEKKSRLSPDDNIKLMWLFDNAEISRKREMTGKFLGPRKEIVTPWSTNAVEITQNMGIDGISRIEIFKVDNKKAPEYDPMLQRLYTKLDQSLFDIDKKPEEIKFIKNISAYNKAEGLALSAEEVAYLEEVSKKLNRELTDSEVYGFAQVNSEHCRHKIFNGTFEIDGEIKEKSLFDLIKKTSKENPNRLVSAYKDNVAFVEGPKAVQFAPEVQDKPAFFKLDDINTVLSIKAETHNFPTTVEPFNGAATGSGGEIRDRMAGGKASVPMAGTAVYMTSYPRIIKKRPWELKLASRKWLYKTPEEILIKASNGASDFGNKFGQPLICGSVLTFEHFEKGKTYGYDKVIMMAGGIGYAKEEDSKKDKPTKGDKVVVLGGDNYRIGMGGGAVSSVATGEFDNAIELNAVQRSNPEMQKRVFNVIRAMSEASSNPIVSIHDHGAGGHLNSLSELLEDTGGTIYLKELPVGDPTLSYKEIIGNESQERMGLVIAEADILMLKRIAERERAPMYVVGDVTEDMVFKFVGKNNKKPVDLKLDYLFGSSPKTILKDTTQIINYKTPEYDLAHFSEYLHNVLQIEAVACKDWLTNKVDRSVTGKVAMQQTAGTIQLPLNNLGIVALDFLGEKGMATSIGHAPIASLVDPKKGAVISIAEALTNIIWAPIEGGLEGISLSANWMWPAKNAGEDARLYQAVEAVSDFACKLGINIPTGKDSMSMTQKYPDGDVVYSPGTVIISASAEVTDVKKAVSPVLKENYGSTLLYIDLTEDEFQLGGSSFCQTLNKLGDNVPTVQDAGYFKKVFNVIQKLIKDGKIDAGHDISAGGMIVCLLEMCFGNPSVGLDINLSEIKEEDITKLLFSENPGIIIQVTDAKTVIDTFGKNKVKFKIIGKPIEERTLRIFKNVDYEYFDIDELRDVWFKTSYHMDCLQCGDELAKQKINEYKFQELKYNIKRTFTGKLEQYNLDFNRREETGVRAAIIREKGVNGDREMAYSMFLAGFDVKDVHMTDLISGRETLEDVNYIVFVGGFSNSDVLGSAKGWAGAFLYNDRARMALENFYKRDDTLSLGICNGCQLMVELNLIYPKHRTKPKMLHNESGKFESAFLSVQIQENDSVMLKSLSGARLGIWVAHGEGKFSLPYDIKKYKIPVTYRYDRYPGNPNGSDYSAACIVSDDGRHLAMMPHIERAILPWQWASYPDSRKGDEITPWLEAFINARDWIKSR